MVENPPAGIQRIIPHLFYEDGPAAIEFLCKAFAFEERFRVEQPDGRLGHAEIGYQDNIVMLASVFDEMGYSSQKSLPSRASVVVCYVDDVDSHFSRAKGAGAKILREPEDQFYGDRMYMAEDPEGHQWAFHTHIRDVPPEELKPPQ